MVSTPLRSSADFRRAAYAASMCAALGARRLLLLCRRLHTHETWLSECGLPEGSHSRHLSVRPACARTRPTPLLTYESRTRASTHSCAGVRRRIRAHMPASSPAAAARAQPSYTQSRFGALFTAVVVLPATLAFLSGLNPATTRPSRLFSGKGLAMPRPFSGAAAGTTTRPTAVVAHAMRLCTHAQRSLRCSTTHSHAHHRENHAQKALLLAPASFEPATLSPQCTAYLTCAHLLAQSAEATVAPASCIVSDAHARIAHRAEMPKCARCAPVMRRDARRARGYFQGVCASLRQCAGREVFLFRGFVLLCVRAAWMRLGGTVNA